jgi:hypothetical protein
MLKRIQFLFVLFFLFSVYTVFSDDNNTDESIPETGGKKREDIWFCLNGDASMYSYVSFSYGGGFAFGYGSGSSIGLKATYFINEEGIDTLEACLLLRFYLLSKDAYSGPFFQFLGGVSLFNRSGDFAIPSNVGIFSAGLGFGWRFIIADRFFIEPMLRGGYPYLVGVSISAGIRF